MGYGARLFGAECEGGDFASRRLSHVVSDNLWQYHRDFLPPLLPVYAAEFQALAPQEVSYGDLEVNPFLWRPLAYLFHDHPTCRLLSETSWVLCRTLWGPHRRVS